jgi:hypothetical protein
MIDNEPVLPCPPWCATGHEPGGPTSHQLHRYTGDAADGATMVTLYMNDCGTKYAPVLAARNGEVDLHISIRGSDGGDLSKSIVRPVREARALADMAIVFGREDVAEIIVELAALDAGSCANEVPGLSRG